MDKLDLPAEIAAWLIALALIALVGHLGWEAVLWHAGAM